MKEKLIELGFIDTGSAYLYTFETDSLLFSNQILIGITNDVIIVQFISKMHLVKIWFIYNNDLTIINQLIELFE